MTRKYVGPHRFPGGAERELKNARQQEKAKTAGRYRCRARLGVRKPEEPENGNSPKRHEKCAFSPAGSSTRVWNVFSGPRRGFELRLTGPVLRSFCV